MSKSETQWQPITFVMKKDATGTNLNGIEVKHIQSASEIVNECERMEKTK